MRATDDQPADDGRHERPPGHGRPEEQAGGQDGIRGQDDGQGHERDADPGIRLADARQEAQTGTDATGDEGQQGGLRAGADAGSRVPPAAPP